MSTLPKKSSVGYTIKDVESVLLEDLPSLPGLMIDTISIRADLSSDSPKENDFPCELFLTDRFMVMIFAEP